MMKNNQISVTPQDAKDKQNNITFQTFGESTSIPLSIKKAVFNIADPAPFLRRAMIGVELTVVNNAVEKDISGKLKLTLPQGATVKKFEFLKTESDGSSLWYPATAVPKKEAKAVVYKEKEKGREVAAVSDVASGSNVFEIEVSPLPFQKEVKCRVESLVDGCLDDLKDLAASYFSNEEDTEVSVVVSDASNLQDSDCSKAGRNAESTTKDTGGAAVGDCFGKTHFVCRVPGSNPKKSSLTNKDELVQKIKRIAIVWDASASMSKETGLVQERCGRLRKLANQCNQALTTNNETGHDKTLTFELFTFGTGVENKGNFGKVDDLIMAINDIDYDGGTDVTPLSTLISDLAARSSEKEGEVIDSVLVFSDGMDNLGRLPDFSKSQDSYNIGFPVHCVADGNEVNLKCLRCISAASPLCPGKVFTRSDENYADGVLFPQPILKSIRTDQADDAFMEEIDDGFLCVPDHRLQYLNEPIGSNGVLISGVLGNEERGPSTVTKITAEVLYGTELQHFHFQLHPKNSKDGDAGAQPNVADSVVSYRHIAVDLSASKCDGKELTSMNNPASILGHVYAEETFRAAEKYGLKSGMDTKIVSEELSIQYGFCSPESSLLMLYSIDQFLDNGILPPRDHPVYDHQRAADERKKREEQKQKQERAKDEDGADKAEVKAGDIGGLKTKEQMERVLQLSRDLDEYFNTPPPCKTKKHRQQNHSSSRRRNFGGGLIRSVANSFSAVRRSAPMSNQRRARSSAPQSAEDRAENSYLGEHEREMCMSLNCAPPTARSGFLSTTAAPLPAAEENYDFEPVTSRTGFLGAPTAPPQMPEVYYEEEECRMEENMVAACPVIDSSSRSLGSSSSGNLLSATPNNNEVDFDLSSSDQPKLPNISRPKDAEANASRLEEVLIHKNNQDWKLEYISQRKEINGPQLTAPPSFFLTCARLVLKHATSLDAVKIATNCLELSIEDAQMLRCVGYFLLSTGEDFAVNLAIQIFDKVQELQPCEPQSYLDGALARFWRAHKFGKGNDGDQARKNSELQSDIIKCQQLLSHVLTHQWADRFYDIEWPALILLHCVADLVMEHNSISGKRCETCPTDLLPEWPISDLACFQSCIDDPLLEVSAGPKKHDQQEGILRCSKFDVALMVWLGWDTDKTDIDLHVKEPSGNEVYYGNRFSDIGGHISRDFTQGYGPEVYILKDQDKTDVKGASRMIGSPGCRTRREKYIIGEYHIYAKYYASHQDSMLTGATSAVLWTLEKAEGSVRKKKIDFHSIRLSTHKEMTEVGTVQVSDI